MTPNEMRERAGKVQELLSGSTAGVQEKAASATMGIMLACTAELCERLDRIAAALERAEPAQSGGPAAPLSYRGAVALADALNAP